VPVLLIPMLKNLRRMGANHSARPLPKWFSSLWLTGHYSPYGSDPMNEVTVWTPMLLPPNADLGDGGQSGSPLVGGVGAIIGASGAGVAGATSSVTGANIPFSGMASSGSSQNPKSADGLASAAAQYAHGVLGAASFIPS
jgi:hypothetical protein